MKRTKQVKGAALVALAGSQLLLGCASGFVHWGSQVPKVEMVGRKQYEEKLRAEGKPVPKEDKDNDIVCQQREVTGSRFNRTICRPGHEWKREAEEAHEYTQRALRGTPQSGPQ
jgi:hypothetical protein